MTQSFVITNAKTITRESVVEDTVRIEDGCFAEIGGDEVHVTIFVEVAVREREVLDGERDAPARRRPRETLP